MQDYAALEQFLNSVNIILKLDCIGEKVGQKTVNK